MNESDRGLGTADLPIRSSRLILDDPTEADLPGLLDVALSNPQFLATHEGSADAPGRFDQGMLERDLALAALDPGRHPMALRATDTGRVIGWADTLDEHPRDLVPWIGLLEVHGEVQRQGLGREAAEALAGWYRDRGARLVRVGVDDGNDAAAAFWARLGYVAVDRRERPSPLGTLGVDVLELDLVS